MSEESEIELMIKDCLKRTNKMNPWETTFIHRLHDLFGSPVTLTDKQLEKLESIWEKVTS